MFTGVFHPSPSCRIVRGDETLVPEGKAPPTFGNTLDSSRKTFYRLGPYKPVLTLV